MGHKIAPASYHTAQLYTLGLFWIICMFYRYSYAPLKRALGAQAAANRLARFVLSTGN